MTLRLSKKEFAHLLNSKNKKTENSISSESTLFDEPELIKTKKSKHSFDFEKICQSITNSEVECIINNDSFTILFYGARILSTNQVHTLLQQKSKNYNSVPYKMVKYKKVWAEKIESVMLMIVEQISLIKANQNQFKLNNINDINKMDQLSINIKLDLSNDINIDNIFSFTPMFSKVKLTDKSYKIKVHLLRQAPRLLDEDNVYGAFKFPIDCFRQVYTHPTLLNSFCLLEDDNKNIISKIESFQIKNKEYALGIKFLLDYDWVGVSNIDEWKNCN